MKKSRSLITRIGSGFLSAVLFSSSVLGAGCADDGGPGAPAIAEQAPPVAFSVIDPDGRALSGTLALDGQDTVVTLDGHELRASLAGAPEPVRVADDVFEIRQGEEAIRVTLVNETDVVVDLPTGSVRMVFPGGIPEDALFAGQPQSGPQVGPGIFVVRIALGLVLGYAGCLIMANVSCGIGNVKAAYVYDWLDALCAFECK